jgi:hypothetical protein
MRDPPAICWDNRNSPHKINVVTDMNLIVEDGDDAAFCIEQ